jgi:hypothetical protein
MQRLMLVALLGFGGAALAEEGRPLSMETVDHVIEQHDRAVQGCHRGSNRHDTLAVQLILDIDPSGAVANVAPADKSTTESQCLARLAKKLHFPATGVETKIAYPFMLMPQLHR